MIGPAVGDDGERYAGGIPALGFAYDGPSSMTAGSLQRWTLTFIARRDLSAGARIGVAHRWPSDWGLPQSADPGAVDFLEVEAASGTGLRWWNARLSAWHPFDHVTFVELAEGLAAGDTVTMRYGEARGGSPGCRVQSFIEEASPFSLRFQPDEAAPWTEFARHVVQVVGAGPARLVLCVPSRVVAGEPFDAHVRLEDSWGNPAALEDSVAVEISGVGRAAGTPVHATLAGYAAARFALRLDEPGVHRLAARAHGRPALEASGNPVEVCATRAETTLYWGDLHGQSVIGCGARSIDAYYAHARDFAGSDFCSHQANCFLVSRPEWADTEASTRRYNDPGRFVTLLGVEWSAVTPLGGDHNLYFPGDTADLRRCSHEFIADKSDAGTDLPHVEDLHRHYRGSDTLIAVHVGGRTASLDWHEPALDRLLEVHSTHATSEWFLFDALRRGYRMGVIAGSDGVDGRPGNSHPGHMGVRNVRGGLTAVFAESLTREALWEALRARHCYATTGERILLDVRLGDARMGDAVNVDVHGGFRGAFEVRVEGTAPIERVDFFRGTQRLHSVDAFTGAGPTSNRLRVAWKGASAPGNWQRARMRWDGALRVEGARILGVRGHAFDTPDEGVDGHDAQHVRWRSVTAGDWDGVVLELDAGAAAELWFASEPMTLRTRLADLGPGGKRFVAHDPERSVELRWLPERLPSCSFHGTFDDPAPLGGEHAYWVRVQQGDGAFAWSSPIFVSITGANATEHARG